MFINKIGTHHLEYGENCQDFGKYETLDDDIYKVHKLVCDGCSEGKHTEVGAKLFTLMNTSPGTVGVDMQKLVNAIGSDPSTIRDLLCFTILDIWDIYSSEEDYNVFSLHYCGDGYVITQDHEDNINFIKIDDGEFPKYYAYNFINDKSKLSHYQDGVEFTHRIFKKSEYKNVGVASDGIRYIVNCEDENLKNEFIDILKQNKEIKMKRFINKHQSIFKDDVTISF